MSPNYNNCSRKARNVAQHIKTTTQAVVDHALLIARQSAVATHEHSLMALGKMNYHCGYPYKIPCDHFSGSPAPLPSCHVVVGPTPQGRTIIIQSAPPPPTYYYPQQPTYYHQPPVPQQYYSNQPPPPCYFQPPSVVEHTVPDTVPVAENSFQGASPGEVNMNMTQSESEFLLRDKQQDSNVLSPDDHHQKWTDASSSNAGRPLVHVVRPEGMHNMELIREKLEEENSVLKERIEWLTHTLRQSEKAQEEAVSKQ